MLLLLPLFELKMSNKLLTHMCFERLAGTMSLEIGSLKKIKFGFHFFCLLTGLYCLLSQKKVG